MQNCCKRSFNSLTCNIMAFMKDKFFSLNLDFLGFTTAILCAIHCAFLPLIIAFSAWTSIAFLQNPLVEWTLLSIGLIVAWKSLRHSYLKHHQKLTPIILASIGILLIVISHLFHQHMITAIGGSLIAIAHFINWQFLKNTKTH